MISISGAIILLLLDILLLVSIYLVISALIFSSVKSDQVAKFILNTKKDGLSPLADAQARAIAIQIWIVIQKIFGIIVFIILCFYTGLIK